MVNRREFERDLINNHGCEVATGDDTTLKRTVGGQTYYATFGNHAKTEVKKGEARSFLKDLGFTGSEYQDICDDWSLI